MKKVNSILLIVIDMSQFHLVLIGVGLVQNGENILLNSDYAIKSYVSICNRALSLNKDRFPFKQILGAAQKSEKGKKVEVLLAGAESIDSYVFSIKNEQIIFAPHSECGQCKCDRKWHLEWTYLQEVLKDPESYIKNPAKIDWDWIYDTVN